MTRESQNWFLISLSTTQLFIMRFLFLLISFGIWRFRKFILIAKRNYSKTLAPNISALFPLTRMNRVPGKMITIIFFGKKQNEKHFYSISSLQIVHSRKSYELNRDEKINFLEQIPIRDECETLSNVKHFPMLSSVSETDELEIAQTSINFHFTKQQSCLLSYLILVSLCLSLCDFYVRTFIDDSTQDSAG